MEARVMKSLIATAAVCGVSLFGSAAVAGAAGNPPNPNPAAIAHVGTACTTVITQNPNVNGSVNFPGNATGIFDGGQVGSVFCGL
jgi:multidrug efflux pump subunit AcrA (membrane-fusion protein)